MAKDLILISKHRAALMGIATLWVFLFHFGCPIPVLKNFTEIGYGGVDIFLLLSGFGLFFSLSKKEQTGVLSKKQMVEFYRRRFLRIFPVYFIIVLISHVYNGNYNPVSCILDCTGLSFYLRKTPLSQIIDLSFYDWYIPSIFLLYLFFPFIYKHICRSPFKTLAATFILSFSILAIFYLLGKADNNNFSLLISRWPIFLIGTYAGYILKNKSNFSRRLSIFLIVISIIALLAEIILVDSLPGTTLWSTSLYWTPFILITPGLSIILSRGLDRINGKFASLCSILGFVGSLSLEMYLIHIGILNLWKKNVSFNTGNVSIDFIIEFTLFLLTVIILAFILHFVADFLTNKFSSQSWKSK